MLGYCAALTRIRWLPPGTLTCCPARRLGNKEWRKNATLIPDVDYEPELFPVKHKRAGKVKKIAVVTRRYMLVRSCCFSL